MSLPVTPARFFANGPSLQRDREHTNQGSMDSFVFACFILLLAVLAQAG